MALLYTQAAGLLTLYRIWRTDGDQVGLHSKYFPCIRISHNTASVAHPWLRTIFLVQLVNNEMPIARPGVIQARQNTDAPEEGAWILGKGVEEKTIYDDSNKLAEMSISFERDQSGSTYSSYQDECNPFQKERRGDLSRLLDETGRPFPGKAGT